MPKKEKKKKKKKKKAWGWEGEKQKEKNNLFLILKTCWGLLNCHSVIVNITFMGSNWELEVQIDLFLL